MAFNTKLTGVAFIDAEEERAQREDRIRANVQHWQDLQCAAYLAQLEARSVARSVSSAAWVKAREQEALKKKQRQAANRSARAAENNRIRELRNSGRSK